MGYYGFRDNDDVVSAGTALLTRLQNACGDDPETIADRSIGLSGHNAIYWKLETFLKDVAGSKSTAPERQRPPRGSGPNQAGDRTP